MSPIKTTALAVLIVALGLIASVRFGNAGPPYGWLVTDASNADLLAVHVDPRALRQR